MALTYTAIADASIDAESPFTVQTATRMRDNPIAAHKYVHRSGDRAAITSSTSLVDDGVLEFAVAANQAYEFHAVTYWDAQNTYAAGARGPRTAIDVPASCTLAVTMMAWTSDGTSGYAYSNGAKTYFTTTDDDPGVFAAAGDLQYHIVVLDGIAINGANAGSLKLRIAQGASSGTGTIIKAGSHMVYHRVDSET